MLPGGRSTDAALLLFTSATTGSSKLVALDWGNLRSISVYDSQALQLSETDRLLSLMPLFHLYGLSAVLAQLFAGGSVICTSGFEAGTFPGWLDQFRPTWLTSNVPLHRAILAIAHEHPKAFHPTSLRFIRSSGVVPDPELLTSLEKAAGVPVLDGYGLTETGQHGAENVGAENTSGVGTRVDVVVRHNAEFWFYEIKTAQSPRACLREAMGQLLEYAYWPGAQVATRLIVVGETALDKDGAEYLRCLRDRFTLPLEYEQVRI